MRLLCDLRQLDVWAGTGVPLYRISLAERGESRLNATEEKLVLGFLRERWAALQQVESDLMDLPLFASPGVR